MISKSDQCIALRPLDEGLDGLQSDGVIGICINGTIKLSIDKTYGYNNTYQILGDMDCLSDSKKIMHLEDLGDIMNGIVQIVLPLTVNGWNQKNYQIRSYLLKN